MINVLLVEKSMDYCKKLVNNINSQIKDLRFIAIASNRKEIIEEVFKHHIDIILMDIKVSEFEKVINTNLIDINLYRKSIILILDKDEINDDIKSNPYVYDCIPKSNNFNKICNSINNLIFFKGINEIDIQKEKKKTRIENVEIIDKVKDELNYLGYNPFYNGTKYLIESISMLYNWENYYDSNLEKDIYPTIAHKYHKSVNNIKCNIVNSTNAMYFDCEEKRLMGYLNECCTLKPGPKRIIIAILERIKPVN